MVNTKLMELVGMGGIDGVDEVDEVDDSTSVLGNVRNLYDTNRIGVIGI